MKFSKEYLVSVLILFLSALLWRSMSHGEEIPLRKSFADFPLQVERWSGKAQQLDQRVLDVLRVDDYVLRQFWDGQGLPLELYVGYYKSQRQGATYHSPKNCLPGAGWMFTSTETMHLQHVSEPGKTVEINTFIIQKGLDKQLVLYWYQDRGRIITSEYWAKLYMIIDAMFKNRTDGAFVRIMVPFTGDSAEAALTQGRTFAEQVFPLLDHYLPN